MIIPGFQAGDPRTDAADIVKDFVDGVKPIVALEHDGFRGVAGEHPIEEIKRLVWHRMGMRISEEGTL